jgi:hypothetical protein
VTLVMLVFSRAVLLTSARLLTTTCTKQTEGRRAYVSSAVCVLHGMFGIWNIHTMSCQRVTRD